MHRIHIIRNQLAGCPFGFDKKDPNEPVIVFGIRSPITKAKRGGLSTTYPEEILSQLFSHILSSINISPNDISDIIIGNALQGGCGFVSSRAAQRIAGIPETVPLYTVNRLCNSGLQAIIDASNAIKNGKGKIIIAGGVESMSLNNFGNMLNENLIRKETLLSDPIIQKVITPMGLTNENICERFNISREAQDKFAYDSHMKAAKALKDNKFKYEILPIKTKDNKLITIDDIIRPNTTIESLSKLKPVFKSNGTTTAGNSSPLSDGGALCLLMSRKKAVEYKLPILGKIIAYSVVGVPPEIMGIGPSIAIPSVLKMAGLDYKDIDLFEINEAFAGQALYCIEKLNLPKGKVNIHGGAIALGHPLGCTGARMVVAMLNELHMYNKKRGIVSMCIGTGMGAACIIERE